MLTGVERIKQETNRRFDQILIKKVSRYGFEKEAEEILGGINNPDFIKEESQKFISSPEVGEYCDDLMKKELKKEEKVTNFVDRFKDKLEELKLMGMAAVVITLAWIKHQGEKKY